MAPPHTLYLLRHAKSSWDDPALADRQRPLAKRGRKAGRLIADHLRERGVAPDAVLRSPSVRTEQTWELVRAGLPEGTAGWRDERIYGASAQALLDLLRELPPELGAAMLVGHNPGIQELATTLAGSGDSEGLERIRRKYPTGALATLVIGCEWLDLRPGVARLESFVRPKQLG